jgi:hypothetical protein
MVFGLFDYDYTQQAFDSPFALPLPMFMCIDE